MTRQLSSPTPKVHKLNIVAPVNKGGTGGSDTATAAVALGALSTSDLGKAGGPLKLQPGKVVDPANYPTSVPKGAMMDGPSAFYVSRSHTLTITNYDKASDASYAVSVTGGTVSRVGNTITFVGPASPGVVQLTVGGRTVNIQVKAPGVLQPSVVTPTDGATNQAGSVAVSSSAFAVSSGTPSHQFTDWELATTLDFSNVVQSSFNDTANKTSWNVTGLSTSTNYYLRVRYKDTTLGYSDWSAASKFTTKASFAIGTEDTILVASDRAAGDSFGWRTDLDINGTRLVIGALQAAGVVAAAGAVYVFVRSGSNWTLEQKIQPADVTTAAHVGRSVAITDAGDRIVIGGDTGISSGVTNSGCAYVYVRSGTTWTLEQKLLPAAATSGWGFGYSVSIDSSGTRCIVGEYGATAASVTAAGQFYVYIRSGSTWTQEAKLNASDPVNNSQFATALAISGDGTRCIVGANNLTVSSAASAGAAYVYSRTGTTWTQEAKLTATVPTAQYRFGNAVTITDDGSRVAIGEYRPSASVTGSLYIFLRSGTSWALEGGFQSTDNSAGDQYGQSVSFSADGSTLAVSAVLADYSGATDAGAVFLWKRAGNSWTWSKISAATKLSSPNYGCDVSLSKDGSRLAVGSAAATISSITSGAVYIYS